MIPSGVRNAGDTAVPDTVHLQEGPGMGQEESSAQRLCSAQQDQPLKPLPRCGLGEPRNRPASLLGCSARQVPS